MATNGTAVDAIQRELIKGAGKRKKKFVEPKSEPTHLQIARHAKALKGVR